MAFPGRTLAPFILIPSLVSIPLTGAGQALEEVVVTARKKEESLADIPFSVSAFSASQITKIGARSNYDIANFTVNFNTMAQNGRRLDRPVIRGMNAPASRGEPNASYFIDGVYVSDSVSTASLGAIERVEILRGPQSALFGRATFSGAVNYVTKPPTNELEGQFDARAGTHDSYTASGWVSGPIIEDKLLGFVSGSFDKYGGEWHNNLQPDSAFPNSYPQYVDPPQEGDTSRLGGTETQEYVGKLVWNVADNTELMFKLSYTEGDDDHYPALLMETDELNCYVPSDPSEPFFDTSSGAYCGVLKADGRETRLNLPDFRNGITSDAWMFLGDDPENWIADPIKPGTRRETTRYLLQWTQGIGDWNVITRGSYNTDDFAQAFELDHFESRPLLGLFNFYQEKDIDDWSAEIRVETPQEQRLRGQFGAYYYDLDRRGKQRSFPGRGLAQFSDPSKETTENIAFFGAADYDLTDKWTLSVEARWAEDEKTIRGQNGLEADASFDNFTPRLTARYQWTEDVMVYGLVAKGNKPGDFNVSYFAVDVDPEVGEAALGGGYVYQGQQIVGAEDAIIDEEEAWTYEIGTKATWFNGRVTTNFAMFYIDWEDQAVFATELIPTRLPPPDLAQNELKPDTVARNAGSSRIFGLELETSYVITDNLFATLAYGLADAEFDDYEDAFYARTTGLDPDVSGNEIPNNPKNSLVGSLSYSRGLTSELDWFARTDFIYESERYTQAANFIKTESRELWNGRIGIEADAWTLTAYMTNILDEELPSAIISFPDFFTRQANGNLSEGYAITPLPGRDWGMEFQYRF